VREALQAVYPQLGIVAEYRVGPYLFDFAVKDLRLLLEIDPRSTHASAGRKIRDWKKSKMAEAKGWRLVRLIPYPPRRLAQRAVRAVRWHYEQLLPEAKRLPLKTANKPRKEPTVDALVRRWRFLFHRRFGFQPQLHDADIEALESFLLEEPKVIASRVEAVFVDAWNHANRKSDRYCGCTHSTSMHYFFDNIFDIVGELGFDEDYLERKFKRQGPLQMVLLECVKCKNQWPVFEDGLQVVCPKCKSIVPGPAEGCES